MPTDFDFSGQRFSLEVGLLSKVPYAFNRIPLTASVPASLGVALGIRRNRGIVERVVTGSAGAGSKDQMR